MRYRSVAPRRFSAAALGLCACLIAPISRAEDAMTRANRMAYQSVMKCFVASGYASDERRRAGDPAKADSYRAQARNSFDLAYTVGEKLGLSDKQVGRDLNFYQDTELPKFIGDKPYV